MYKIFLSILEESLNTALLSKLESGEIDTEDASRLLIDTIDTSADSMSWNSKKSIKESLCEQAMRIFFDLALNPEILSKMVDTQPSHFSELDALLKKVIDLNTKYPHSLRIAYLKFVALWEVNPSLKTQFPECFISFITLRETRGMQGYLLEDALPGVTPSPRELHLSRYGVQIRAHFI